jgi:hypothetical protein
MAPSISIEILLVPYANDGESYVIDLTSGNQYLRIYCRNDRDCGVAFPDDGDFSGITKHLERVFPGVNPDSLLRRLRTKFAEYMNANPCH